MDFGSSSHPDPGATRAAGGASRPGGVSCCSSSSWSWSSRAVAALAAEPRPRGRSGSGQVRRGRRRGDAQAHDPAAQGLGGHARPTPCASGWAATRWAASSAGASARCSTRPRSSSPSSTTRSRLASPAGTSSTGARRWTRSCATARPDAVAIMMGTNDTQSIWRRRPLDRLRHLGLEEEVREARGRHDADDARRRRPARLLGRHADHEGELAQLAHEAHQQASSRSRPPAHPGAQYVDVWPLFTTASGSFDAAVARPGRRALHGRRAGPPRQAPSTP